MCDREIDANENNESLARELFKKIVSLETALYFIHAIFEITAFSYQNAHMAACTCLYFPPLFQRERKVTKN